MRARDGRDARRVCRRPRPLLQRRPDPLQDRRGRAGPRRRRRLLAYLAALLLVPSEDSAGGPRPGAQPRARDRRRGGPAAHRLALSSRRRVLLAALLIPLAFLVAAGVLVWWLVSGEGPSGDAGRHREAGGARHRRPHPLLDDRASAAPGRPRRAARRSSRRSVIAAGPRGARGRVRRPVRWLILPAVALALSAGTVSAAGIDLDGGVGERDYRPASRRPTSATATSSASGELVVDLRDTDLPAGDTPLEVDLGVGQARVIVPDDVCVATDGRGRRGRGEVFDRDNGGVDVDLRTSRRAPSGTTAWSSTATSASGDLEVDDDAIDRPSSTATTDFDDDGPTSTRTPTTAWTGEREWLGPTSPRWSPGWRVLALGVRAAARRRRRARPPLRGPRPDRLRGDRGRSCWRPDSTRSEPLGHAAMTEPRARRAGACCAATRAGGWLGGVCARDRAPARHRRRARAARLRGRRRRGRARRRSSTRSRWLLIPAGDAPAGRGAGCPRAAARSRWRSAPGCCCSARCSRSARSASGSRTRSSGRSCWWRAAAR